MVNVFLRGRHTAQSCYPIGVNADNLSTRLMFIGIPVQTDSLVFLKFNLDPLAKVEMTQEDTAFYVDITRAMLQFTATCEAQIQVESAVVSDVIVWQSFPFTLTAAPTIPADAEIAVEQAPYLQELDMRVANATRDAENSAELAATSATNAANSAADAATSEVNASASAASALASANSASASAAAALASQNAAATSAADALDSAIQAKASENAASASATNASASEHSASIYAQSALAEATNAANSAQGALHSQESAATSEANAKASEAAAATSETNAATSASQALASKDAAAGSAISASNSALEALASKDEAIVSANAAQASASNAGVSAANASTSETNAAISAAAALDSQNAAATSATDAAASAAQVATALQPINNALEGLNDDVRRIEGIIGVKKYIIRWDKVNSQCTRLGDAASISTDITHFAYRGSVDPDYNNPFDSIYPWSQRKLCKVSLADYQAIYAAGGDILGAVTLWEDEPGFALGDSVPGMDMVYTPTFWDYVWEDADYVYVGVADGEVPGWNKRPATIGARYPASDDGSGGLTSLAGTIAKRFTPMDTLHARATAQSMTIDDIYTWSDDTTLLCVEFATLNSQVAVGDGVSDLYKQDATGHPLEAATASNSVILPKSYKSAAIVDAVLDIGTALGGGDVGSRIVVSAVNYTNPAYCVITFSGEPVDVAPTQFWAIHGLSNTMNAEIGSKSGYIGANSLSIAYYRGREAHGNYWRYVLGAYRQQNTGHIWTADSREQAGEYDALNTAVHTDTGFILPQGEGGTAIGGYLGSIYLPPKTPLSPFGKSVGGTSLNPIGDYIYVPALTTGNTILNVGAIAYYGPAVGRSSANWYSSASHSSSSFAVLLFLKNPQ